MIESLENADLSAAGEETFQLVINWIFTADARMQLNFETYISSHFEWCRPGTEVLNCWELKQCPSLVCYLPFAVDKGVMLA